jgi:hypothetical protein
MFIHDNTNLTTCAFYTPNLIILNFYVLQTLDQRLLLDDDDTSFLGPNAMIRYAD